MSTEVQQSAIAEVRDQISLDFADGEYLNQVTANLGMTRPPFGFSDDAWRAITKVLALQYKQIRQKFRDVLAEMFGPQVTQGGTLTEDVDSGVTRIVLNNTEMFPQQGTLILDEGLGTEETLDYSYIDRRTNTVYLEDATTFAHSTYGDEDDEQPLVFNASSGDTTLYLARSIFMPTTFPATLVIGRGTDAEEIVGITANNTDTGAITVSPALTNDHTAVTPTSVQSDLSSAYVETSEFLVLSDTSQFPDSGYVRLAAGSTSIIATGGTATTVSVTLNDLTADRQVGSIFVFDGNVTPALAGVEAEVVANTSTGATFKSALPATPASGDTFSIRPFVRYTRNNYTDNTLQIARDIVDTAIPSGTEVELLRVQATALLAPVKVAGGGWDVIQSTPRNVELLLPPDLQDENNLLSASFLHPEELSVSTTTSAGATAGDTTLSVTSAVDFPPGGTILLDSGGGNEEYIGYTRSVLSATYDATASTPTTLNVNSSIFGTAVVGQTVYITDTNTGLSTSREIASSTATSITFTDPLNSDEESKLRDGFSVLSYYASDELTIPDGLVNSHLAAESVEYYEAVYAGTNLPEGNVWSEDHTWSGPYLYNIVDDAPNGAALVTDLTDILAGPTRVAVEQLSGNSALEVANATSFPLGVVSPFTAIVGRDTGNRETITIDDVNLKQRTSTTVATTAVTPGDTSIEVTALSGGGTADTFPDVTGYRVILDRGTVNEEVVYVSGTDTGPDRLLLVAPATTGHSIGATVELMADVLSVDPLDNNHNGAIKYTEKLDPLAPIGTASTLASAASEGDSSITVADSTGFPTIGEIHLEQDTYKYSRGAGNVLNILNPGGLLRDFSGGTNVYVLQKQAQGERVEVLYDEIDVTSITGLPTTGGDVILNYGRGVVDVYDQLSAGISAGTTAIVLDDSSAFPTTYPYEIVIGEGTALEERALVTLNDGITTLTINSGTYGTQFAHSAGVRVSFYGGAQEKLTYTSASGTTLSFSTPVMLQSNHSPSETVLRTADRSQPRASGFDFPFRMPTDIQFRLQFLLDLIRAAGVQVTVIDQR